MYLVEGTCTIDLPLAVRGEMRDVCSGLVAELWDGHLLDGVRPRVEVDLAALFVERKVGHVDCTFSVYAHLGHPCDHAGVRYPRVEVVHLFQVFISSHALFMYIKWCGINK